MAASAPSTSASREGRAAEQRRLVARRRAEEWVAVRRLEARLRAVRRPAVRPLEALRREAPPLAGRRQVVTLVALRVAAMLAVPQAVVMLVGRRAVARRVAEPRRVVVERPAAARRVVAQRPRAEWAAALLVVW